MRGLGVGGGRLNCKVSLIDSIDVSQKQKVMQTWRPERIMFGPSHTHLRSCFCFIFSYTLFQYHV